MESFELQGEWWLDEMWNGNEIPEERVAGTLSFSPKEGGELDLIGAFQESANLLTGDSKGVVNIYGNLLMVILSVFLIVHSQEGVRALVIDLSPLNSIV